MSRVEFVPGWQIQMDKAIHDYMQTLAKDVFQTMEELCPVDSGTLKADLDYEVNGKEARIGAKSIPYAIYAEEGTGPHIEKAHGGALFWAGADHPVNEVHHPGYHGSHFMKRSLYQERT